MNKSFKKVISILLSFTIILSSTNIIFASNNYLREEEMKDVGAVIKSVIFSQSLFGEDGVDNYIDFLELLEYVNAIDELDYYIREMKNILEERGFGEGYTKSQTNSDLSKEDAEKLAMSSVFADRMLYADYVAEDIVKTDPGNRGIENERIYMYISHFIDRKGGSYDPINNPLDDPHLAKYIVRNDRDNYDLFLSKANGLESIKQFLDLYNAGNGLNKT